MNSRVAFEKWFAEINGPEPTIERTNLFPLETAFYRAKEMAAWEAWRYLSHKLYEGSPLPFQEHIDRNAAERAKQGEKKRK
jgi:hypothetical protein